MVGNEPIALKTEKNSNIGKDVEKDINKINALKLQQKNSISEPVERVKFEGLGDDDSICSNEPGDKLPPIPDGGWGWVVVFAAFLASACADGLAYSFGILHEEFTNYFETSQSKTSLIGSLFISIPLISGPIMSALVDRYGCRIMTIIAGLVATIGFLLAALSNSVMMLCLTLGVISGLAMGILYVTSVVSVAFWFDKRRTLAVSLASCGIGFGTLVYSPLTNFFIELYDWRNALVLLAGTILNMCVCGALMRDPDWVIIKEKREKRERKEAKARSRKSSSAGSISSKSIGGESFYLTTDELNDLITSGKSPEYILEALTTSLAEAEQLEATTQMNAEQSYKKVNSTIHLPTFIQRHEQVPREVIENLMENKKLYNILLHNYPEFLSRRKSEININVEQPTSTPTAMNVTVMAKKPKEPKQPKEAKEPKEAKDTKITKDPEEIKDSKDLKATGDINALKPVEFPTDPNISNTETKPTSITPAANKQSQANWLSRQLYTDHQYLRDMSFYKSTIMHRGAMMTIPRYKLRASSLPDIYRNSTWSLWSDDGDEKKWYHRIIDGFKSTFDMRMFTEFHFLLFNIGSLILFIWSIIPYFFLKSYMTSTNVEGGALMISIIGIASGVGIVALGWAGDQPWMNVTKGYAVCLFICGLSVGAYPLFITNYWALAVVSTVFGLSYASSYSYTPAILIELIPIDYFTIGYGFILLSQGLGHLIGPPLGGLLFDITGRWDITFYAGGVWLIVAGLFIGLIAYTNNFRICGTSPLLNEEDIDSTKNSTVDV